MKFVSQGEEILSQSSLSRADTTAGGGGGDSDDETIPDDDDEESDVVNNLTVSGLYPCRRHWRPENLL